MVKLCQDFTMYQTTIRDNILLGNNKNLSDEYIFRILDLVGIGEFVRSLPGQLETNLGQLDDYGVELSKGQEQKIALSRIILNSDAPIWVLMNRQPIWTLWLKSTCIEACIGFPTIKQCFLFLIG